MMVGGTEKSQKINCNKPKLGDHTGFQVRIETDGSNEVARRTPQWLLRWVLSFDSIYDV